MNSDEISDEYSPRDSDPISNLRLHSQGAPKSLVSDIYLMIERLVMNKKAYEADTLSGLSCRIYKAGLDIDRIAVTDYTELPDTIGWQRMVISFISDGWYRLRQEVVLINFSGRIRRGGRTCS